MKVDEDSNINGHLNQLKQYWERINQMNKENFKISDVLFKINNFLIATAILGNLYRTICRQMKRNYRNQPKEIDGIAAIYQYSKRRILTKTAS